MNRLFALAATLLLAGCVTVPSDRYVDTGDGYYYPAYDDQGDYYAGYDYDDSYYYGYDDGYHGYYDYGYTPFWRLDRYRCRAGYYRYCNSYWRPYGGWSFSISAWDPWYWSGYGHYSSGWYYYPQYWHRPSTPEPERPRNPRPLYREDTPPPAPLAARPGASGRGARMHA